MDINVNGANGRRGALIVFAAGLLLVGAAFAFTWPGKVVAQSDPTAHQYVVGVSGMH
jgi:hypothetical protein